MATTIEQAIIDHLKADTTVSSYVGGKIYYLEKDKNAPNEYIVITNPSHTRDAITQTRLKAGQARLQANCVSRDKWRAKSIAEAVKEAVRNKYGTIQSMSVWDIKVSDCRPLGGVSDYRFITEFIVNYSE